MEYPDLTPEERQQLLDRWRSAFAEVRESLAGLTDDEIRKIQREVTEELDEITRQEALRLRRQAS